MAICQWCGNYNDQYEWPEYDRGEYSPLCCHKCYMENPRRVLEAGYTPDVERQEQEEDDALVVRKKEAEVLRHIDADLGDDGEDEDDGVEQEEELEEEIGDDDDEDDDTE